jgi:nickel/cobalt exporter
VNVDTLTWLYLPTAFLLGIAHAIEPGHSKTIVASYLISIKGKVSDAITLGLTVTITHTLIIVLLAIGVIFLGKAFPLQEVQYWLELLSGLMVFVMGVWLVWSRSLTYLRDKKHKELHEHGDEHEHHHGHHHNTMPLGKKLTIRQLIIFGLSGGLIPCPAALAILILAVGTGKPMIGLTTVIIFSLGLALALIGIGITVCKSAGFVANKLEVSGFIKKIPIISSLVVTLLGLLMLIKVLFGHSHVSTEIPVSN